MSTHELAHHDLARPAAARRRGSVRLASGPDTALHRPAIGQVRPCLALVSLRFVVAPRKQDSGTGDEGGDRRRLDLRRNESDRTAPAIETRTGASQVLQRSAHNHSLEIPRRTSPRSVMSERAHLTFAEASTHDPRSDPCVRHDQVLDETGLGI